MGQTGVITPDATGKSNHTLQIDRRSHVAITGVQDVTSFHETEIILRVDGGELVLTGENLHVAKLLLEDGQLAVDGRVDGVLYQAVAHGDGKRGLLRRIFHG